MENSAQAAPDPPQRLDTIGVLLRRWKFITIWTIIVMVLVGGLSSLLPDVYSATAYLLINPSPYKSTSLEQPPLTVDTYENILRSLPLVEEVRTTLNLRHMTLESLRNRMRVELIRRASVRETTYAPMLLLRTRGTNPKRCQAIANAWADIATSASLSIKGGNIQRDNERIRTQFTDTKRVLEEKEDALTTFNMTAQLVERQAELAMIRKQLTDEQQNLEQLRLELSVAQTRLGDLKHKYASFFIDGIWIGTLYGATHDHATSLTAAQVEPLPLQFLLARNTLLQKFEEFTNLKINERVDIVKRQYDTLVNKITRFEQDIEDLRLKLATEKAKLLDLESEIKTVPTRLVVGKAITADALWTTLAARPGSLDELTSKVLATEHVNPVWLSMEGRMQYLRPEVASLEARLRSYEALLPELRDEQTTLNSVVVTQTQTTQNLETEKRLAAEHYETLSQVFLEISRDIMTEEGEVARLEKEIANSERQVDRLTSTAQALNDYAVTKRLEEERLQRDLASVKNMYTSLATKYEEARITELEISGDLQIISRAVLPESKIGPSRARAVASAFLCGLVLFSLFAIAREHVRRQVA